MKILMVKNGSALLPANDASAAVIAKLAGGAVVQVEVTRPRNLQHLRLYWALISKVWENLDGDRYPTPEDLSDAVKIAAGHRTRIELPDGSFGYKPGSIAFCNMSQDEFNDYYDKVCDLIAKHFLPGVTSEQLKAEVAQMIGVAA